MQGVRSTVSMSISASWLVIAGRALFIPEQSAQDFIVSGTVIPLISNILQKEVNVNALKQDVINFENGSITALW